MYVAPVPHSAVAVWLERACEYQLHYFSDLCESAFENHCSRLSNPVPGLDLFFSFSIRHHSCWFDGCPWLEIWWRTCVRSHLRAHRPIKLWNVAGHATWNVSVVMKILLLYEDMWGFWTRTDVCPWYRGNASSQLEESASTLLGKHDCLGLVIKPVLARRYFDFAPSMCVLTMSVLCCIEDLVAALCHESLDAQTSTNIISLLDAFFDRDCERTN